MTSPVTKSPGDTGATGRFTTRLSHVFVRKLQKIASVDLRSAEVPADVLPLYIDVADSSAAVGTGAAVLDRIGLTAILVNDAATITPIAMIVDFAMETGMFMAKAVVPAMRESEEGSIIIIASEIRIAGSRGRVAYSASKAALIHFTLIRFVMPEDEGSICLGPRRSRRRAALFLASDESSFMLGANLSSMGSFTPPIADNLPARV